MAILSKQTTFFDETEAAKPLRSLGSTRLEKLPKIHLKYAYNVDTIGIESYITISHACLTLDYHTFRI